MDGSDNVRGAENQQERLWNRGWVVGFVDGEGCFSCPIFPNRKTRLGWQVQPSFTVVQSESSRDVLEELVRFFGCGKVYVNRQTRQSSGGSIPVLRVRSSQIYGMSIVPFFIENELRTSKRENFEKFTEIIRLMDLRLHQTMPGIAAICADRTDDESSKAICIP